MGSYRSDYWTHLPSMGNYPYVMLFDFCTYASLLLRHIYFSLINRDSNSENGLSWCRPSYGIFFEYNTSAGYHPS
jgi:hypothetical protein